MTISINSRPSSAFARWCRSLSQSNFRPSARTELTTLDSSTKTSTLAVRIESECLLSFSVEQFQIDHRDPSLWFRPVIWYLLFHLLSFCLGINCAAYRH